MSITGRQYLDPGDRMSGRKDPPELVTVLAQWACTATGPDGRRASGPRNVLVQYPDGHRAVIPFARRLRKAPEADPGQPSPAPCRFRWRQDGPQHAGKASSRGNPVRPATGGHTAARGARTPAAGPARHTLMRLATLPAALLAAVLAVTGCGSSPTPAHHHAAATPCTAQLAQWASTPGARAVPRLATALRKSEAAAHTYNLAGMAAALGKLAGISNAMATDPVPPCADTSGTWQKLTAAAADAAGQAAQEESGSIPAIRHITADMNRISAYMQALTSELPSR